MEITTCIIYFYNRGDNFVRAKNILRLLSAMKKKSKHKTGALSNLMKAAERQKRKEQGFFDGRFAPKSVPSEKVYSRKSKHKKQALS